jgi:nicotinate-nucleotide adenylyltransferase
MFPHKTRQSIGVFGGTFDPIHFGHLRSALEVQQTLKLDEVRLIPCRYPPHRETPSVESSHRLQMVAMALENSILQIDDQEIKRESPSYTVDTLLSLRQEFPEACLCMIVGVDAFLSLPSWYQWEKLIELANIIVMHRVGWNFPEQGQMSDYLKKYSLKTGDNIKEFKSGVVVTQTINSLNIQASRIRAMIKLGESPQFLLPENVLKYIRLHGLYGYNRVDTQEIT